MLVTIIPKTNNPTKAPAIRIQGVTLSILPLMMRPTRRATPTNIRINAHVDSVNICCIHRNVLLLPKEFPFCMRIIPKTAISNAAPHSTRRWRNLCLTRRITVPDSVSGGMCRVIWTPFSATELAVPFAVSGDSHGSWPVIVDQKAVRCWRRVDGDEDRAGVNDSLRRLTFRTRQAQRKGRNQ